MRLQPLSKQLNEVTVTAKTPIVKNRIDKMVYNTANDITSQGGVALDMLKKVPKVSVDVDLMSNHLPYLAAAFEMYWLHCLPARLKT